MKTVFITRHLEPNAPLRQIVEKAGYRVTGESLVQLAGIRFAGVPACDWIFFSGKSAIRYFFSADPDLPPQVRFAVMGRGSQLALRRAGFEADFAGSGNDARRIGRAFARQVTPPPTGPGIRVLFVCALDTPHTVQQELPLQCRWRNLYVYKNEPRSVFQAPAADVLVFTSPFNASVYFGRHVLLPGQKVVAIGTGTLRELKRLGVPRVHLPADFYERKLAQTIVSVLDEHPLYPDSQQPADEDRAA